MNNLAKVTEWAVWVNLDKISSLELTLLKGHLILELLLDDALKNIGLNNQKELSFFSKVKLLNTITNSKSINIETVQTQLFSINRIRNQLAHEWQFKIDESKLESWSLDILSTINGKKFSKYTYRTKIIHAFSFLSGEIIRLNQ